MAEDSRRSAVAEPALRDDRGQVWPWPPTRGPEDGAAPRAVWLVFLPGAFTPVCTGELGWLGELADDLAGRGVAVRVISCDPAPVLRRVRDELGLPETLALLSDFWPHGAACAALEAFDAETGRARRVSVLLDADGAEAARVTAAPGRPRTRGEHEAATHALLGDG